MFGNFILFSCSSAEDMFTIFSFVKYLWANFKWKKKYILMDMKLSFCDVFNLQNSIKFLQVKYTINNWNVIERVFYVPEEQIRHSCIHQSVWCAVVFQQTNPLVPAIQVQWPLSDCRNRFLNKNLKNIIDRGC